MKSMTKQVQGEELFVGIDLHKRRWHVTIRTADVEILSNSIVGRWEDLGGGPQKLDNVLSSESVQNRKELTNGQKTEKVQFRV